MQDMPKDLNGTYAGKVYQAVYDKYHKELNDDVINVEIADICEFMLLHDKFSRNNKYIDETNAKTDEELHYLDLLKSMKNAIASKHLFDSVLESLTEVSDYNDKDEVNQIVKDIFVKGN